MVRSSARRTPARFPADGRHIERRNIFPRLEFSRFHVYAIKGGRYLIGLGQHRLTRLLQLRTLAKKAVSRTRGSPPAEGTTNSLRSTSTPAIRLPSSDMTGRTKYALVSIGRGGLPSSACTKNRARPSARLPPTSSRSPPGKKRTNVIPQAVTGKRARLAGRQGHQIQCGLIPIGFGDHPIAIRRDGHAETFAHADRAGCAGAADIDRVTISAAFAGFIEQNHPAIRRDALHCGIVEP